MYCVFYDSPFHRHVCCWWHLDGGRSRVMPHFWPWLLSSVYCYRGHAYSKRLYPTVQALPLHLPGNSKFLQLTALPHLVCQLPYTEPRPRLSQPASSSQLVASILQATLTDRLLKTEKIPPQQVERLCTAALAAWPPSTVERYSHNLVEW